VFRPGSAIDYCFEETNESWRVRRRHWGFRYVLIPSVQQKLKTSSPKKRTVSEGAAIEDNDFKPEFEIVSYLNQIVESQLFTSL
jgi:hypothetical protein